MYQTQFASNGFALLWCPATVVLQATYKFTLPYVKTVQTNGLQFPVRLWYDGPNDKLRVDVFAGVDSTVTIKVTYLAKLMSLAGRAFIG